MRWKCQMGSRVYLLLSFAESQSCLHFIACPRATMAAIITLLLHFYTRLPRTRAHAMNRSNHPPRLKQSLGLGLPVITRPPLKAGYITRERD